MALLAGLLVFYAIAHGTGASRLIWVANALGPTVVAISLGVAALLGLRAIPSFVWTAYFWVLASSAAFFGVGPLAHVFGDAATLASLDVILPVTPEKLLFTNALDAAGLLIFLLGVHIIEALLPFQSDEASPSRHHTTFRPEHVAVLFLALGGALEFGLLLPRDLGALDVIVPGVLNSLGLLYILGLIVAAYLSVQSARWQVALWVLWIPEVVASLLRFSKQSLVLALVLPPIGAFLAHGRLRRLAMWGAIAAMAYYVDTPLVNWGREHLGGAPTNNVQAAFSQRLGSVEQYSARADAGPVDEPEAQGWWTRLDYAPPQTFAVQRYDRGLPGHSLAAATYAWIPRAIWPNKPILTQDGVEFSTIFSGNSRNSVGLGIFGEGYWDDGWIGVVLLSLIAGLVYGLYSCLTLRWMQRRAFVYLPLVSMGITAGLGLVGRFAEAVVGGFAIFCAYWLAVWLLETVAVNSVRSTRLGHRSRAIP